MASKLRVDFTPEQWAEYLKVAEAEWAKFDPLTNTIWCDMDGVVADFDTFIMEKMGRTFSHNAGPGSDKEMWEFLATVDRMYYVLPPMPDTKLLWDGIKAVGSNREMLTAIPRRSSVPTAEQDKKDWMQLHRDLFGEDVKVNIGPYSRDKWKWAKPGDILIDDRLDNIVEWIEQGKGIGILHAGNVKETLATLHRYVS